MTLVPGNTVNFSIGQGGDSSRESGGDSWFYNSATLLEVLTLMEAMIT